MMKWKESIRQEFLFRRINWYSLWSVNPKEFKKLINEKSIFEVYILLDHDGFFARVYWRDSRPVWEIKRECVNAFKKCKTWIWDRAKRGTEELGLTRIGER